MRTIIKPGKVVILISFILLNLNVFSQENSLNRMYEVWDDQPAPNRGSDYDVKSASFPYDADWEMHSYPIGNDSLDINLATISNSSGKRVALKNQKQDFVEFETTSGETYYVTNIPVYQKPETPTNLNK